MAIAEPAHASADEAVVHLLLSPDGRADPYPTYRWLLEHAPVHRSGFGPMWFLSRYEDCRSVLRDPHLVQPSTVLPGDPEPGAAVESQTMLFGPRRTRESPVATRSLLRLNPPDHTRLRGLVSRGFTPRRVEALRPAIEAMTDELLDAMAASGEVDVLDVLAFPLPVKVIGELVGVPPEDRDAFRPLVRTAASGLEPGLTDEQLAEVGRAADELQAYFRDLIATRRRDPRDDLTSVLLTAHDEADRLTEDEMVATLILVFAAGFETTTNLIGNGLVTLLRNPDELARLRADPGLTPLAVEELLRYESPVQFDARRAAEPTEVAGRVVETGEWVMTFLGAANRDPAVWDDPDTFRITARDTPVLSFGSGIHYCLGASLARLEGQVVFRRLLERFAHLELVEETPAWRNTFVLRGLDRLPVRVSVA
ncbi:MAG: cytochrome P450 [Acidimicrobiales bacterium]|jgi:cytochrome P450|nr:cytochrome P450 [Acidimicrobiales bacterium]